MISNRYRLPGIALLAAGMVLTVIYFVHRVDLSLPVFAFQSSYLETKYFTVINTNVYEELILLCYFSGFLLTVFSREKMEYSEYAGFRALAWRRAVLYNSLLLVFFTIFVYGKGFMMILVVNLFSIFIFYCILFFLKVWKFKRMKEGR